MEEHKNQRNLSYSVRTPHIDMKYEETFNLEQKTRGICRTDSVES